MMNEKVLKKKTVLNARSSKDCAEPEHFFSE